MCAAATSTRLPASLAGLDVVPSDPGCPERVDAVVIGGGIVGCSAALELTRRGLAVALCEKGWIAGEQSGRNWGWCRLTGRDSREIELMRESLRIWDGLDAATGADTGFRRSGGVFATDDPGTAAKFEAWAERDWARQLHCRVVTGDELGALLPGGAHGFTAALYAPEDGAAEPTRAAPAIARQARREGAAVLTGCAVRAIETAAGRIAGVVTERGRIACDRVIVAGGAWSRLLLRPLGVTLPQLSVRATVTRTEAADLGLDQNTWTAAFALRKRADGGYNVATSGANAVDLTPDSLRFFRRFLPALRMEAKGLRLRLNRRFLRAWRAERYRDTDRPSPYEAERVLDPEPVAAIADDTWAALTRAFPAFGELRAVQRWSGLIDVTPDTVPVISIVDAVPGLTIATGFSGHGFGLGPGAGRLAADLAADAAPLVDPHAFRLSRFTDGSPIHLESWL
jgi:glycine/D-amino acid oxidase-like deaminating enzyme